jgi:hypothetical protein
MYMPFINVYSNSKVKDKCIALLFSLMSLYVQNVHHQCHCIVDGKMQQSCIQLLQFVMEWQHKMVCNDRYDIKVSSMCDNTGIKQDAFQ